MFNFAIYIFFWTVLTQLVVCISVTALVRCIIDLPDILQVIRSISEFICLGKGDVEMYVHV